MFQKLSWSGQLLAGLVLLGVSFLVEALVLTAYFGSPLFGFAVAGGLELTRSWPSCYTASCGNRRSSPIRAAFGARHWPSARPYLHCLPPAR